MTEEVVSLSLVGRTAQEGVVCLLSLQNHPVRDMECEQYDRPAGKTPKLDLCSVVLFGCQQHYAPIQMRLA